MRVSEREYDRLVRRFAARRETAEDRDRLNTYLATTCRDGKQRVRWFDADVADCRQQARKIVQGEQPSAQDQTDPDEFGV